MGKKAQNKETPDVQNNNLSDDVIGHILQNLSMDELRPKLVEIVAENLLLELRVETIAEIIADTHREQVLSRLMQILIEKLDQ